MKKATLLTFLFAVLMIALLVSCNTTPDPLPDESTSDEVTPEPTDVTSDEAEVSEPVETTTEAVTTRKEYTTTQEGVAVFVYMEPIDSEYWSESEQNEPVAVADTEVPWVITEWETAVEMMPRKENKEIPEEKSNLALRVPKSYEFSIDDVISVKVEFFQEYYPIGSYIPVRYTIQNISSNDFLKIRYDMLGQIRNYTLKKAVSKTIGFFSNDEGCKECYSRSIFSTSDFCTFDLPCKNGTEEDEQSTVVFEYLYYASPDIFDAEGESEIIFRVMLVRLFRINGQFSAVPRAEFPLEIVEVEYIDP